MHYCTRGKSGECSKSQVNYCPRRSRIDYNCQQDKISGFSEWGDKYLSPPEISDQALVYMIRNKDGWKVPIAYRFVQGTVAISELASNIKEMVLLFKATHFTLVGTFAIKRQQIKVLCMPL